MYIWLSWLSDVMLQIDIGDPGKDHLWHGAWASPSTPGACDRVRKDPSKGH